MKELGVLILDKSDWLSSLEFGPGEADGHTGDGPISSKKKNSGGFGEGSGFCDEDGGWGCGCDAHPYNYGDCNVHWW